MSQTRKVTNRTERAVKGGITGLIQHVVIILFQLLITPLILARSGQEMLGAYSVVLQIVGYTILLDFGFSVALTRYLSQVYDPQNHDNRFSDFFIVGRNVLFFTNLLVSVLLILAAYNIHKILPDSPTIQNDARNALYLMSAWSLLRTPLYIYSFVLTATQDLSALNIITVVVNVVKLVSALGFVYFGLGLIGLIASTIVSELVGGIIQCRFFRRFYPDFRTSFEIGNITLAKEMFRFGLGYWGVNLSVVLLLGSDNLIAGKLYGAAAASVFYTTKMFASLLITFITKIIDQTSPGINQIIGAGNLHSVKNLYLRLFRYLLFLTLPAVIGLLVFVKPLISIWVGPKQFGGQFMTVALSLFVLLQVMCHLNGITTIALGKLKHWTFFSVFFGFLAVSGAFFLGKKYGLGFIPLSMAISMVPILFFLVSRVKKQLSIHIDEISSSLKGPLYVSLPLLLFLYLYSKINYPNSIIAVFLAVGVFCLVWITSIWFFGLNKTEKLQTKKIATGFFQKERVI